MEVVSGSQGGISVADTDQLAIPCVVFVVDRVGRNDCVSRSIKRRRIGGTFGVHVLIDGGEQNIRTYFQFLGSIVIYIQTTADTLQSGLAREAFLFQIRERGVIIESIRASGDRRFVRLVAAFAEQHIVPVHIPAPRNRGIIVDFLVGIGLSLGFAFSFLDLSGRQSVVDMLTPFFSVHNRTVFHGKVGLSPVGFELDRRFAGLAALGGDEHHAVGCARTVERCGGGILDDGDVFDVGAAEGRHDVEAGSRIDRVDRSGLHRHAVDYVKRSVARIERTHTADIQRRRGARLSGRRGKLHSGGVTLQKVFKRYGGNVFHLLAFYVRSRAGIGRFLERTVTGDYDFFHHLRVRIHLHIDRFSGYGFYLHACVTDVRNLQCDRFAIDLQRKLPIEVARRALCRSFHKDVGSDDRFARFVYYTASDLYKILGSNHSCTQKAQEANKKSFSVHK